MEMSGNTPPYKHDPKTVNVPVRNRLSNASHHQAAARERGVHAFSTGFAHSTITANHVWAVSKILDADAWIGTLKSRLGLPDHILNTLPEEKDIVGQAFGFEANHPDLFRGSFVGQLGVYFSYETRNHTMFGNLNKGYFQDYSATLTTLFRKGICPHTVFTFPEDASTYPVILVSSAAKMTETEIAAAKAYLKAGGKLIVTGPSPLPGCEHSWELPRQVNVPHTEFFTTVPEGESWAKPPQWMVETQVAPSNDPDRWFQPEEGLHFHPHRISSGTNTEDVLSLCRQYMNQMPIGVLRSNGYLCTMFEDVDQITVHFLAEDYDVDIDHELDRIRFHRSRVNLITKVEPIGIDGELQLETAKTPEVYTPFCEEASGIRQEGNLCTITLPEKCSYVILRFPK